MIHERISPLLLPASRSYTSFDGMIMSSFCIEEHCNEVSKMNIAVLPYIFIAISKYAGYQNLKISFTLAKEDLQNLRNPEFTHYLIMGTRNFTVNVLWQYSCITILDLRFQFHGPSFSTAYQWENILRLLLHKNLTSKNDLRMVEAQ